VAISSASVGVSVALGDTCGKTVQGPHPIPWGLTGLAWLFLSMVSGC
jgi:hypothetical protein